MTKKKSAKPRKRAVGRPSREKLGLDPTQQVTLRVETKVIDLAKAKYGSLGAALRAAVGY